MKVGIVGMGIAGLRAAMLLEAAGHEVHSFEARDRVGGRLETSTFSDGTAYESGGEWIDADHERVKALVAELGLEFVVTPDVPRQVIFGGETTSTEAIWPDADADQAALDEAADELGGELVLPAWVNQRADLDGQTVAEFIRRTTASDRGNWWVSAQIRSDEGDDPDRIGLLGWLCGMIHYRERAEGSMSALRVRGGWGGACEAIAARLKHSPRLSMNLRHVTQTGDGVELEFADGSCEFFDAVVLTLPPGPLDSVQMTPPLPSPQSMAIQACGMSRAIKVAFRFDRPWWRERGLSGSFHVEGRLQQLWDGSHGGGHVLLAYVCGDDSVGMDAEVARLAFEEQFPDHGSRLEEIQVHDWVRDPFARGAFSHLAPGYATQHMAHLAAPHGRVFFAGEHTATWTGFIVGALESAERVVAEIGERR
ncbi:MAG: flavin monoamine oxidase family protein [Fimbriimonas sp.]